VRTIAKNDLGLGLLALVVAGLFYYFANEIPRSLLSDQTGADGLPKLYAIILAVLGIWLIAQSYTAAAVARELEDDEPGEANMFQHVRPLGLILMGAAYLLLVGSVGYLLTICVLITIVALYCGAAADAKLLLISAGGGTAFWLVFVKLFNVPLPAGTVWSWFTG
jgi:putative tricarboxylic transport membrane protein